MATAKKVSPVVPSIHQALMEIQERGVTKKLPNEFGDFKYLKISTIMEEISDILQKYDLRVRFSDNLVMIGDRYYVKALVTIYDKDGNKESAIAFAREQAEKKKMDDAQITGTSSTYARKYALCGLLGIEGEEDPDEKGNTGKTVSSKSVVSGPAINKPVVTRQAAVSEPMTEPEVNEYVLDGVKYIYKSVSSKKTGKTYTGFIPEMGAETLSGEKSQWFLGSRSAAFKKLKEAMDAEDKGNEEEVVDVDDLPF